MIEVHLKATRRYGNLSFERIGHTGSGAKLDEIITNGVAHLCSTSLRPKDLAEWLVIEIVGTPYHTTLGLRTFNASLRTIRRAAERAWPSGVPEPDVYRKAAHILLGGDAVAIHYSPFRGLVAVRN